VTRQLADGEPLEVVHDNRRPPSSPVLASIGQPAPSVSLCHGCERPSDERLSLALAVAATADRRRRTPEPARSSARTGHFRARG